MLAELDITKSRSPEKKKSLIYWNHGDFAVDVPENDCFRRREIKAGVEDQFWYKVDLFIGNLASGGRGETSPPLLLSYDEIAVRN